MTEEQMRCVSRGLITLYVVFGLLNLCLFTLHHHVEHLIIAVLFGGLITSQWAIDGWRAAAREWREAAESWRGAAARNRRQ